MKLYNSLSNNLDEFTPINKKKIKIYVCGITPYDTTHLGHAFTYISFDALIKYLSYKGFEIEYTQNVTDINDRDNDILKRAKEQNVPWQELSKYWTNKFLYDMENLNWTKPNHYLFASQEIPTMLNLINALIKNNLAYTVNGSIYLDVTKNNDYGKLSKLSESEMLKIAKNFEEDLENPQKRHPLDITLWKASGKNQPKHIPSFDSPFGKGRPGWHLECSAMAMEYLGDQIDIHGGGTDLIYPHHESEIAQSEGATGKIPFVKYWMHTGAVFYQREKMSKSLGNLVMVSKLLEKYSANAIRFCLLSHHWHENWEFKIEELEAATKNLEIIKAAIEHQTNIDDDIKMQFEHAMEDNLNTPKALEILLLAAQSGKSTNIKLFTNILGFQFN